jgi:uncharacterized protein involved in cysteine biosynthesis
MRRPNPTIALPALVVGGVLGYFGWFVTEASCRIDTPNGGCPVTAGIIGVVVFVAATLGMAVVFALVARSIAEYRQHRSADDNAP